MWLGIRTFRYPVHYAQQTLGLYVIVYRLLLLTQSSPHPENSNGGNDVELTQTGLLSHRARVLCTGPVVRVRHTMTICTGMVSLRRHIYRVAAPTGIPKDVSI